MGASWGRSQPDEPTPQRRAALELEGLDGDEAEPEHLQTPPRLVRDGEHPTLLAVGLAQVQHGPVLAHLGDRAGHDLGLLAARHAAHPDPHWATLWREAERA